MCSDRGVTWSESKAVKGARRRIKLCARTLSAARTGMPTIQMQIPDDRHVYAWWEQCSEAQVADALDAIGTLYTVIQSQDAAHEIRRLQNRLEGASEATAIVAKTTSESVASMYAQQMDEKNRVIALLTEQCTALRSMFDNYKANSETQHRITEQVMDTLKSQQRTTISAQQMGSVAEDEVEQLVIETLACEVENTSHAGGCGDRLVTTPDGMQLMLEVKNVERLHSKHDIDKFKKDIYANAEKQTINAALLISLKTTALPNISGPCSVWFMNTPHARIPVVMLSCNTRTAIQLALHGVSQLQSLAAKESMARGRAPLEMDTLEAERTQLQRVLPMICRHIHETESQLESRIELLQRLMDDALSERTHQKEIAYQMLKLQQSVSWLAASQEGTEMDFAVSIVHMMKERTGEFPKTAQMTQPQRLAVKAAGGLKAVIEVAKKRQRTE